MAAERSSHLGSLDERAVDLHRDASLQEVNRQNQQATVWSNVEENALQTGEHALRYPHPVAGMENLIGDRHGLHASQVESSNRLDLGLRNDGEPLPSVSQDLDEPAGFLDLQVAIRVSTVMEEEVPGKQGDDRPMPDAILAAPYFSLGQKDLESLLAQLIVDVLFALGAYPQDVPGCAGAKGAHRIIRARIPWGGFGRALRRSCFHALLGLPPTHRIRKG
jgi:hypothetical protein